MRPLRLALAATAFAAAAATTPATAALPEGCYGLPDRPLTLVCVTEFNPGAAVPTVGTSGGSTVTIPAYCAGQCYPATPVSLPTASWDGEITVVEHNGERYVIAAEGTDIPIPPIPPLPPVNPPQSGSCPGDEPIEHRLGSAEPYVCARYGYSSWTGELQYVYVGTCATEECTTYRVRVDQVFEALAEWLNDPGTLVEQLCPAAVPNCR